MAINKQDIERIGVLAKPEAMDQVTPAQKAAARVKPGLDKDFVAKLKEMRILIDGEDGIKIDEKALKDSPEKDIKILQTKLSNSNIYVPENSPYYADGKAGGLTTHALSVATDAKFAEKYIVEKALRDNALDKNEIMKLQSSLSSLGYDTGDIDGKFGKKTALAIKNFINEHPDSAADIDPSLKKMLAGKLEKGAMRKPFENASAPPLLSDPELSSRSAENKTLLRPELLDFVARHPEKQQYIDMAMKSAEKYHIDPRMFANQIFQESNTLNPHAKGIHTKYGQALGIAQMLPGTARQYGLSREDLFNPSKAIEAAAHHMADLTAKHGGSQALALIEYNGGGNAVPVVERALKTNNVSIDQWMTFMEGQRERHGTNDRSKWRVQTFEYVQNVVPQFWDDKKIRNALDKPANKPEIQETKDPFKGDDVKPALDKFTQNDINFSKTLKDGERKTAADLRASADFAKVSTDAPVIAFNDKGPKPTAPAPIV